MDSILYGDRFGEIIDRPEARLIELRWFDTTVVLSKDGFQQWLEEFASRVKASHRPSVLIDSTSFRMPREHMDAAWRDANIIPLYNAGPVERFAFHMPAGVPMIGAAPAREGPATFPTAYFGARADALSWLGGS
jgi:hypothetical protein